jgi:hypothetical protein
MSSVSVSMVLPNWADVFPLPPNGPYIPQAELEGIRQEVLIPEIRFTVGRMSRQSILWGSSPTLGSGRDRFGWRSLIG